MTHAHAPRRHRGAFTLIELLVVIALIAVLAALSAGAYARVRASAMEGATNATIQKLASALDTQMKAAIDTINGEDHNAEDAMVGGDPIKGKALHRKFAIRKEFPQSFDEARAAKPVWGSLPPSGSSGLSAYEQSAVCLYLALGLQRRGTATVMDEMVGGNAVKTIGSGNWKVYTDAWGTPIGFVRWPYGNTDLTTGFASGDPQDPESLLSNALLQGQGLAPTTITHRNVIPVLVSAGPDKNPGYTDQWMTGVNSNTAGYDNVYSYRLRRAGTKGN